MFWEKKRKQEPAEAEALGREPLGAGLKLCPPEPELAALARLGRAADDAPPLKATLAAVYARVDDSRRRGPWWTRKPASSAAVLTLAGLACAALVLLPNLKLNRDGRLALSPPPALASSVEYALAFPHVQLMNSKVRGELMSLNREWARELSLKQGIDPDQAPTGRFLEFSKTGELRVYLVYQGAAKQDIEELQRRVAAVPEAPAARIVPTTLVFSKGLPQLKTGMAADISGTLFCIAGELDDRLNPNYSEVQQQLHQWMMQNGVHLPASQCPQPTVPCTGLSPTSSP